MLNRNIVPARDIHVQFRDTLTLLLTADFNVGIGGDKWPAAESFCNFITDPLWKSYFEDLFAGKRIIELGSGNGMAGILIDKIFSPSEVIITDLASHVPLIEHNIETNQAIRCKGCDYDWINPPEMGKFDIVLGFECVYRKELYQPFVDSLRSCAHASTILFVGLTRAFATPEFFVVLGAHFSYTLVPKTAFDATTTGVGDSEVGLFVLRLLVAA